MPIRCSNGKAKYRYRTFASGKKVRLAFCGTKVKEAKSYSNIVKGGEKMAHVKGYTRKVKVHSKRAKGLKGVSYKYVHVKGHSRKKARR